ncbi:cobalt ECF transporter T component CbiQ [Anaeroselena agilis]|uniref:Cobalt ECF transporter T component CbiQ n=1 Tax=Anaeroselena agilis TaxID=3063788 RepID=A0ABU3P1S0_9FIRM|nr:cobalt ECF transporter T component CbiQ [Selenomonadales bacterium 4137-cl]
MTSLPIWLTSGEPGPLPVAKRRWRRADYLTKTLAGIQEIMAEDMLQTGTAARRGLLQPVEPRVKIAGTVLLLLAAAITTSIPALAAVHGLLFLAALASGIGARDYLLRVWLPAGVFAGLVVLPAILSWVTPGDPLLYIYRGVEWRAGPLSLPADLAVTRQGLSAAAMVLLRSAASLGLVLLLVKTTRWPVLTKAFQSLGVPAVFVMVLELTYRYLFLFLLLLADFLLGRRSRLVGGESAVARLEWIGGTLAGFLRLAGEYSREIAAAMTARGYGGAGQKAPPVRPGPGEAVYLVTVITICFILLGGFHLGKYGF